MELPGYTSQLDPEPRQVANEQFWQLEQEGVVALTWLPGQAGHLLESMTLDPDWRELRSYEVLREAV